MLRERARELAALRQELKKASDDPLAAGKLKETERDLRYASARVESALLVDNAGRDASDVLFGAVVEARDADGAVHRFSIVGQDEADAASDRLSWTSPLARALFGSKAGDTVVWPREEGERTLEIVKVSYPPNT